MLAILVFVSALFWYIGRVSATQTSLPAVDRLKNALLAFALAKTCANDMSDDPDYDKYDGTMLPRPCGFSLANACFTYILDVNEFRQDPLYCVDIESKINAIQRYIDKNLDTNEKTLAFFEHFTSDLEEIHTYRS